MKLYVLLILIIISTFSIYAQRERVSPTPSSSPFSDSENLRIEAQVKKNIQQAEAQINDLLNRSGASFRTGLNALQDGMRQQAGDNFDKSLEVFLYSTVNVQLNQKLSDCYNQLVETIYRIEFPTNQQPPNIRSLSATCGWNVTNEVADNVVKLVLIQTNDTNRNLITAAVTNNSTQGFQAQEFIALQTDELAQLPPELNDEEEKIEKKTINKQKYQNISTSVRVVKAQSGDTVATLAAREKVSAVDVAKFNGLLPSTKLVAGREIKIPLFSNTQINQTTQNNSSNSEQNLGEKPVQARDGKVKAIIDYFNEYLHDPYSMRVVRWSKVVEKSYRGTKYWAVQVKYRAKNTFGAYVLSEQIFYIKNNKIVAVEKI